MLDIVILIRKGNHWETEIRKALKGYNLRFSYSTDSAFEFAADLMNIKDANVVVFVEPADVYHNVMVGYARGLSMETIVLSPEKMREPYHAIAHHQLTSIQQLKDVLEAMTQ